MVLHPAQADPVLTVNIYAGGMLDDLLRTFVANLASLLKSCDVPQVSMLWVIRYSRRGEHLKLRLHGPKGEEQSRLRDMLTEQLEQFVKSHRHLPPVPRPIPAKLIPAIDPEDELDGLAVDRTYLWTSYRRSAVSFPGDPWLSDDVFIANACNCLAQGCELVLDALRDNPVWPLVARQKLLLIAVLAALRSRAHHYSSRDIQYVRYHRDWLVRFSIPDATNHQRLLDRFDESATRMSAAIQQVDRSLCGTGPESLPKCLVPWSRSISQFAAYNEQFQGSVKCGIDSFTSDITFPPTFKVLHGLANQIGLTLLEEAYVYHLMDCALTRRLCASSAKVEMGAAF